MSKYPQFAHASLNSLKSKKNISVRLLFNLSKNPGTFPPTIV